MTQLGHNELTYQDLNKIDILHIQKKRVFSTYQLHPAHSPTAQNNTPKFQQSLLISTPSLSKP